MWWLHRHPEGLESDLRAKIGQNGISSRVCRQDLISSSYVICQKVVTYSWTLAITWGTRHRSVQVPRPHGTGLARMSVASPSQIGRISLGDSYVPRHGRKSVTSHSWNWSRVATFESHRRDIRASRVTREWHRIDLRVVTNHLTQAPRCV